METFLSVQELRTIFEQLMKEYECLCENSNKLEDDCNKLREHIDSQVKQIKVLSHDFDKLKDEYARHQEYFASQGQQMQISSPAPHAQYQPEQAPNAPPAQQEEQAEQDWELISLVPAEKIPKPVIITLMAEILDVSVICSTAFSPDGTCLAIGSNKTLRVYNIEQDDFLMQHTIGEGSNNADDDAPTNHVRSIAWTDDSKRIICAGEDGHIRIFELENGELIQDIKGSNGEVFQVQIANNGSFFATATGDGNLSLYSMSDFSKIGEMTRQIPENEAQIVATSFAISDDDSKIFVGYSDKFVYVWDVKTKTTIVEKECHSDGVYSVKYLSNHRIATASLDSTVKIWDQVEENGKLVNLQLWKELVGHKNFVLSLAVDPTGKWLLSGSKDLTARLSSIETGEMIYSIKAHTNSIITVAFNPSGAMFCTGSGDQSVKIWSISPEETEE